VKEGRGMLGKGKGGLDLDICPCPGTPEFLVRH